jgi:hypothetical protein
MEIVLVSVEYNAYTNIRHLCACRGMTLKGELMSDIGTFNEKISDGFLKLEANDGAGADYIILFIVAGSDYRGGDKLDRLVKSAGNKKIIIMKSGRITLKNNIECEIIEYSRYLLYNWAEVMAAKGRSLRLVSDDEFEKEWQSKFYIHKHNLPLLSIESHEVVWHGLKLGDVVELIGPSMSSSGMTSSLRLVAP